MPVVLRLFAQNKIDAKTHFKITRSANHETNALAVANKQVDIATNNSENLDKIKERFPEKFKDIKVVWSSPLIPLDPLVMRKDLPEATKTKIKDFFYSYGKTERREKKNLWNLSKLSGFKASTNAQLVPIRQLELFRDKTKIEADTKLADAEKKSQDRRDRQEAGVVEAEPATCHGEVRTHHGRHRSAADPGTDLTRQRCRAPVVATLVVWGVGLGCSRCPGRVRTCDRRT